MTRPQQKRAAFWIGFPFLLLIVLYIINPGYEVRILERIGPTSGISLLVGLQAVNALVTVGVTMLLNRRGDAHTVNGVRPNQRPAFALLYMVTGVFFLLPSLWIVLLYPSLADLLLSGGTF